jgi:hypothetical protein
MVNYFFKSLFQTKKNKITHNYIQSHKNTHKKV